MSSPDTAFNIFLQGRGFPGSSLTLVLCSLDFVQMFGRVCPDLHGAWWVSGLLQGLFIVGQVDLETVAVPIPETQAAPRGSTLTGGGHRKNGCCPRLLPLALLPGGLPQAPHTPHPMT